MEFYKGNKNASLGRAVLMISVIISTYNRPVLLEKALRSLIKQSIPHEQYEIIVGDSNSTYKADLVIERLKVEFPSLDLRYFYHNKNGGYTDTKHKAIKLTRNNIIAMGDDDSEADYHYLEGVIEAFDTDEKIAIVMGKLLPKYTEPCPINIENLWKSNQYGKYLTDYTLLDFGDKIKEIPYQFVLGSNFAIKKDIFETTAGFAPDGFGGKYMYANGTGETFLAKNIKKMGYRIIYQPKMLTYHNIEPYRFEEKYFKARHYYYGISHSFDETRQLGRPLDKFELLRKKMRFLLSIIKKKLAGEHFLFLTTKARYLGYFYHQSRLKKFDFLLDYVLRENWFDYDFSKLPADDECSFDSLW
jgi:GT2 family glycosyltransferase